MGEVSKIADLTFDPNNARVRTAKGEKMIQDSLNEVGAARSIVIDENNVILAGNGTVEAAGQIGISRVRVIEASGDEIIAVRRSGLTDEQKKKLAYYDNRTGDEAEWDMEQVARDLLGGYDFLDELFDDIKLPEPDQIGGDDVPDDPAEVLREKWGVEYGDLWQIGDHRILCGDSTKKEDVDRLLDGATPGMVFTDPPYGFNYVKKSDGKSIQNDGDEFVDVIRRATSLIQCDTYFICGDAKTARKFFVATEHLGEPKSTIVWVKPIQHRMHRFEPCHEFIWYWGDNGGPFYGANVFEAAREIRKTHPTIKPVELVQYCIKSVDIKIVVDLFAGSGTTLVAAHNESRTCYAMEIDPAYVAVCLERMSLLGYEPEKSNGIKRDS
tara:strand:- start:318 stop:1466 length:1149 start_codon:yes stop_codon:yes gene_type:complete